MAEGGDEDLCSSLIRATTSSSRWDAQENLGSFLWLSKHCPLVRVSCFPFDPVSAWFSEASSLRVRGWKVDGSLVIGDLSFPFSLADFSMYSSGSGGCVSAGMSCGTVVKGMDARSEEVQAS